MARGPATTDAGCALGSPTFAGSSQARGELDITTRMRGPGRTAATAARRRRVGWALHGRLAGARRRSYRRGGSRGGLVAATCGSTRPSDGLRSGSPRTGGTDCLRGLVAAGFVVRHGPVGTPARLTTNGVGVRLRQARDRLTTNGAWGRSELRRVRGESRRGLALGVRVWTGWQVALGLLMVLGPG